MEEQIKNEQQTNDVSGYIDAIQNLKATTVSKEQYQELQEREKKLLKALVDGEHLEGATAQVDNGSSINELREQLYSKNADLDNLTYISKTLELRQKLMESGERDPFLPWGEKISPSYEDTLAAQRVADVFKECIEYADGNSELFTQELMRRTVDARRK